MNGKDEARQPTPARPSRGEDAPQQHCGDRVERNVRRVVPEGLRTP